MPRQAWSAKRERQYEHIREGLVQRGDSTDLAEEIASRTVNKARARAGDANSPVATRSRTSPRVGAVGSGLIAEVADGLETSCTRKRNA